MPERGREREREDWERGKIIEERSKGEGEECGKGEFREILREKKKRKKCDEQKGLERGARKV